ncbi:MAG: DUF72 domain-containing protein [Flavobacteriales bacterium]
MSKARARMDDGRQLHIGTAGWQLPQPLFTTFKEGSHLERYASLFNGVEINSTFYRPHREATFVRWAAAVPPDFRFAVKMHRSITHEQKLSNVSAAQDFIGMVGALGTRLGPVLIQLPPSLRYTPAAEDFLSAFREFYNGPVALEPRHPSWAQPSVTRLLEHAQVARVAADPPLVTDAIEPGGDRSLVYFRLHGAPRVYWSAYEEDELARLAQRIVALLRKKVQVWVIFDNTAAGAAAPNALRLHEIIKAILNS